MYGGDALNILQALFQSATKPPAPIHAGEAFTLWAYYEAAAETRAVLNVLLNHTEDQSLKETIEHFVDEVLEPQVRQVRDVMLHEGVALADVTPDKPKADPRQVPVGARFSDEQVANMLVVKIQGLMQFCHEGLSRSLRDDLAHMYFTFQTHVMAQGLTLKGLMTQRGWLRLPPYFPGSVEATRS